jgi:hypothetical protein
MTKDEWRGLRKQSMTERAEDIETAFGKAVELVEQTSRFAEFNPTNLILGLVDRLLEEAQLSGSNLTATGAQQYGKFTPSSDFNQ